MARKEDRPDFIYKSKSYTIGQIAILFDVCHRTACQFVDSGCMPGYKLPGSGMRRVRHDSLVRWVEQYPQYAYIFDRIIDPKEDKTDDA